MYLEDIYENALAEIEELEPEERRQKARRINLDEMMDNTETSHASLFEFEGNPYGSEKFGYRRKESIT